MTGPALSSWIVIGMLIFPFSIVKSFPVLSLTLVTVFVADCESKSTSILILLSKYLVFGFDDDAVIVIGTGAPVESAPTGPVTESILKSVVLTLNGVYPHFWLLQSQIALPALSFPP